MRFFSFLFFLAWAMFAAAQPAFHEKCGFQRVIDQASDDHKAAYANAYQQALDAVRNGIASRSGEIYYIPVVVHIIYDTESKNISDELVHGQIERLNKDFRRLNEDAVKTRSVFLDRAVDTKIQFYLAGTDPNGQQTTGITRRQTSVASFGLSLTNMKNFATGGVDAWPTDRYLNIWVCDLSIFGFTAILGFATPPAGAPNWPDGAAASQPEFDGVVIHFRVFGENNPQSTGALLANNMGRTCTHEVGHYLGLRHIWGDGGGFSGTPGCTADDGIEDTPNAAAASQGCALGANTCVDSPIDWPDMVENYMDYSNDSCMNMFSEGQMNVMRFCLENFRPALIDSANAPLSIQQNPTNRIKLFPNPAQESFNIVHNQLQSIRAIIIYDLQGKVVYSQKENFHVPISTTNWVKGLYFVRIVLEAHWEDLKLIIF